MAKRIKTNGVDYKAFYNDAAYWGDGRYCIEDDLIIVDGVNFDTADKDPGSDIPDHAVVEIEDCGFIYDQTGSTDYRMSHQAFFKEWLKKASTRVIMVECDSKDLEKVMAAVKAAGGRFR